MVATHPLIFLRLKIRRPKVLQLVLQVLVLFLDYVENAENAIAKLGRNIAFFGERGC